MQRNLFSPRATHGIHHYRHMRFLYHDQWVPGLYIIIDLRRLGLKTPAILAYLQRMERKAAKNKLLALPRLSSFVQ